MLEGSIAGVVFWKHHDDSVWYGRICRALVPKCWSGDVVASESPGLFIKGTCSLDPGIEILFHSVWGRIWESMFLKSSTNDYEASVEITVYQLRGRKQTVNSKGLLKRF